MFVITSVKYYNEFTEVGGGGTNYPNGPILGKVRKVITGYFEWGVKSKTLRFESDTKRVFRGDSYDSFSFKDFELQVGDDVKVQGGLNDEAALTIAIIDKDFIEFEEAVITDLQLNCSIHGITPVTRVELFSNLLDNDDPANFESMTDRGTVQKYAAMNVDATDVVTEEPLLPDTFSAGWFTNADTSFVIGAGVADYRQSFSITEFFYQAPFFKRDQINDIIADVAPVYYFGTHALRSITKVAGGFTPEDPNIIHYGQQTDVRGKTLWYDRCNTARTPEYTLESITYFNTDDEEISAPDLNVENKVEIIINSESGRFEEFNTELLLHFHLLPLDETVYVNTNLTNLIQNFRYDRKFFEVQDASSNGNQYGTDYQALKSITSVLLSVNQIKISFSILLSTATKDLLKANEETDRYFQLAVTTQDIDILTTAETDLMAIKCPTIGFAWDQDDDSVMNPVDYIHCYHFPERGTNPKNEIAGLPGDPVYVDFPFLIKRSATDDITLSSIVLQVLAVKEGEADFELEGKTFTTELIRKLLNVQDIDIQEERGFVAPVGDPFNQVKLQRVHGYDTETMNGYVLTFAFILRYEDWLEVIQKEQGFKYDIFKQIEKVNHLWSDYFTQGWAMLLRITTQVKDEVTGYITTDWVECDIVVKELGSVLNTGIEWTGQYFNEEDVEINSLTPGGITRFKMTFLGDFVTIPDTFANVTGYVFADLANIGGSPERRFANPEYASESTSPFSPTDEDESADESYANGNIRINKWAEKITLEGYYDDTKQGWSNRAGSLLMFPRLMYKSQDMDCTLKNEETLQPLLTYERFAYLNEECPPDIGDESIMYYL